jgi:hypothetical protein
MIFEHFHAQDFVAFELVTQTLTSYLYYRLLLGASPGALLVNDSK